MSLQNLAYNAAIKEHAVHLYNIKIGEKYGYIEKDGTITCLGKLLKRNTTSSGNWHDGWVDICTLNFEIPRNNTNELYYYDFYNRQWFYKMRLDRN